jgi:hypothetical protein
LLRKPDNFAYYPPMVFARPTSEVNGK